MVRGVNNGRELALRHPISHTVLLAVDQTRVVLALAPSQVSRAALRVSSSHNSKLGERVLSTLVEGLVGVQGVRNSKANKLKATLKAEIRDNSTRTQDTKADIGNDRQI